MFRLRYAVAAIALGTCGIGCANLCTECDDFPVPGRYAALPGSYTGPPLEGDVRRGDEYAAPPSPTATQESVSTAIPNAPSSDDGPGALPVSPTTTPFTPPAEDAGLPQLP